MPHPNHCTTRARADVCPPSVRATSCLRLRLPLIGSHAVDNGACRPICLRAALVFSGTRLTGITQSDVESASTLDAVLERFRLWLDERGLVSALEAGTAVFVAHGGWDLVDQLPKECARKGFTLPSFYGTFADLKVLFALSCPEHRGTSLKQMLDLLGLPQVRGALDPSLTLSPSHTRSGACSFASVRQFGRQHSGLDDCRNFARILSRLLALDADVSPTHQIGVGQLRGHGAGRRPGDWDCTACGAIAFASRPNCYRCGEPRVDPPERASPSETRQATTTSSPRERSTRRSGDWDCPSCKAHVFSSKAVCFRCQRPRPPNADSPTPSSGSGGGHGGGRQPARRIGDWDCPNPSCRALVFASRQSCFRCGSPPPMHVQYAAAAAWNSAQIGSIAPIGHGLMHADQMMMATSSMGPTAHQGYVPRSQHGYAVNPTQQYAMAPLQTYAMGQALSGGQSSQGNFHDAMVRSAHEQHQWAQQQAYMAQMAKMAGYTQ